MRKRHGIEATADTFRQTQHATTNESVSAKES